MPLHDTKVAGIPCKVRVTHFDPGYEGRYAGPAEDCEPAYPPSVDFEICDQRGRPAPWLARKATDKDLNRITDELLQET